MTITLEHLDKALVAWIEEEARQTGASLEAVVSRLITRGIEMEREKLPPRPDDLDSLAGTWSDEETEEFLRITSDFNKIDEDMWR